MGALEILLIITTTVVTVSNNSSNGCRLIYNDDAEYETITIFQRKRKSKEATKKSTKSKNSDFVKNNENETKQPTKQQPQTLKQKQQNNNNNNKNRTGLSQTKWLLKVPRSVYSDNIFQRRGKKQKYQGNEKWGKLARQDSARRENR